jgi:hypothetical protein
MLLSANTTTLYTGVNSTCQVELAQVHGMIGIWMVGLTKMLVVTTLVCDGQPCNKGTLDLFHEKEMDDYPFVHGVFTERMVCVHGWVQSCL